MGSSETTKEGHVMGTNEQHLANNPGWIIIILSKLGRRLQSHPDLEESDLEKFLPSSSDSKLQNIFELLLASRSLMGPADSEENSKISSKFC